MPYCKITVLKRTLNADLAEQYLNRPTGVCEAFTEGQEFVTTPFEKPAGFCEWAWNDIYKTLLTLARGGSFSDGAFKDWMKNSRSLIVCCTDGIRPVIFNIEAMVEE